MSVAPTEGLSAEMSGYLPVHCVHQLIKMRTFRKHGFSIKVSTYENVNGNLQLNYKNTYILVGVNTNLYLKVYIWMD